MRRLLLSLLAASFAFAPRALAKSVELRWPPVPDAAAYQIEIRDHERVIELKKVPAST